MFRLFVNCLSFSWRHEHIRRKSSSGISSPLPISPSKLHNFPPRTCCGPCFGCVVGRYCKKRGNCFLARIPKNTAGTLSEYRHFLRILTHLLCVLPTYNDVRLGCFIGALFCINYGIYSLSRFKLICFCVVFTFCGLPLFWLQIESTLYTLIRDIMLIIFVVESVSRSVILNMRGFCVYEFFEEIAKIAEGGIFPKSTTIHLQFNELLCVLVIAANI